MKIEPTPEAKPETTYADLSCGDVFQVWGRNYFSMKTPIGYVDLDDGDAFRTDADDIKEETRVVSFPNAVLYPGVPA